MPSTGTQAQGMPGPPGPPRRPGWLRQLLHGIGAAGVQPRDPRVKQLWDLLRQRGLLARSPWLKARLRYIWGTGLVVRPRPRTVSRMRALLLQWGVLRPRIGMGPGAVLSPVTPGPIVQTTVVQPQRPPAAYRPLMPLRPVRPVRPVQLRPVGRVRPMARGYRGR